MNTVNHSLASTNPEAVRHLALATKFLLNQDIEKALHYSRLPTVAGSATAAITLFKALTFSRRFEGAAEAAAMLFANGVHSGTRSSLLDTLICSFAYLGARAGDCSEAYKVAYELATDGNLNPEKEVWRGQPLRGKSLLLSLSGNGLGGAGDYVMWARFVPLLAALGPRITVQCLPPLARLFATLPGVVSTCGLEDRPPCDFAISVMQLPHVLGVRGIPTANPFNVTTVPFPAETYNVGINWGASWTSSFMDRSCALAEYLPLTTIPSVALYAIQKGAYQRQLYPAPTGMQVFDLAPKLTDFMDTAVCLMSLDAVVTTDNVVANLACMLGRPTFVLVPKGADWRWGDDGQTPWYPSARVYQQDVVGEWRSPIEKLVSDLSEFLRGEARALPASVESVGFQEVAAPKTANREVRA